MEIIAFLQNMAKDELLRHITPLEYEKIKKEGGALEAYVVAHSGQSKSFIVGLGEKILNWYSDIIGKIKDKIKPGTPVFHLHNADNSTENRITIGKVVAVMQNARNEVVSIIHRFKDYLNINCNIASFEAPINFDSKGQEQAGSIEVQSHNIGNITGIALANSETSKPAFAGAIKTAYLQCLRKEENMPDLKLEDVIKYVQENKIAPLKIFSNPEILELDFVKEEIAKHKGNENLFNENVRLKAEKESLKTENETLKTDHEKAIMERDGKLTKFETEKVFTEQLKKRDKLDEKQLAFIEKRKEGIKIEPETDIEKGVNAGLDTILEEYNELSKVFTGQNDKNKDKTDEKPGGGKGEISEHIPD